MFNDRYYFNLCNHHAKNSRCFSRKIAAIIVDPDGCFISKGYNGPPECMSDCSTRFTKDGIGCPRLAAGYKSGEGLHLCSAIHAERSALINAAREGVSVKGCIMFMNCGIPCKDCLIEILEAEISEIVCTGFNYYDALSKIFLEDSNLPLKVRTYDFM